MKPRKIYWRRKNKKIIAEGQQKGKTIYLFTLPEPEDFIKRLSSVYLGDAKFTKNPSLFTKEKQAKIMQKINRLDFKDKKQENDKKKL